uniref:Uncharacterized protein n=1 Tax=Daphnia galeata TaxID=27404 RepID=A0A8J2W364_9CRUS|nr:unnamed protein product [Daphnia galeata]
MKDMFINEFGPRKMPQVKNAPSLLKLCLKCIQINIENNICAAAQFLNSVQLDSDAIVGSTSSSFHDLRNHESFGGYHQVSHWLG